MDGYSREEQMTRNSEKVNKTLTSLADDLVAAGDVPAVIRMTSDDIERRTARFIGETALKLARGLSEQGIGTGDRVLLLAPASPEFFIAALAIFRVGGVMTPVDMQLGDENLEHVFNASNAKMVFAAGRVARRLRQLDNVPDLPTYLLDRDQDGEEDGEQSWRSLVVEPPSGSGADTPPQSDPDDIAVLFYTSGTTGAPKGVPLSHKNVISQIRMLENSGLLADNDRIMLPLPLHHVYPVVIGMLAPLALNVPIVLPHALTGPAISRALREGEASIVIGVPRLYRALFNSVQDRVAKSGRMAAAAFRGLLSVCRFGERFNLGLGRKVFRSVHKRAGPRVRIFASGGSPLDPDLARDLEALGWPTAVGYGLTETSPLLTLKKPGEAHYASVGQAVQGVELKIDPSALSEAGPNDSGAGRQEQRGELLARGDNVFRGYDGLPEKTEESFSDDWFRTGDIAHIDAEGYVYLHGRVSTMIVTESGENIDPEKVEDAYEESGQVDEIGIVADEGRLAALVVPNKELLREHSDDPEKLAKIIRKALNERASGLPSYQRISRVEVTREPLSRTRLGKLKRKQLQEAYDAVKAGKGHGKAPRKEPMPISEMQSEDRALLGDDRVRKLWDMLVRRYPDQPLSPDASLEFDLGVDSMGWVELSMEIEESVGVAVDETWFERIQTVRELMEEVADSEQVEASEGRQPLREPETVIPEEQRSLAKPRGSAAHAVAVVFYALLIVIMKICFRVSAKGLENVPQKGRFVLLPNHVSYIDPLAMAVALGYGRTRPCFWAGLSEILYRNAVLRALSRIGQVIPIDQTLGPLSSLAYGALVLKGGHPLVWFPEGQRSKDGELQPFKNGIGLLLGEYDVPVIPVFIEGAHRALPPGRAMPRFVNIVIHFGKPMDSAKLRDEVRKKGGDQEQHKLITKRLEEEMAALRDQVLQ
ncbi:AMP-binding protein [Desulfonatronum parangueonense]